MKKLSLMALICLFALAASVPAFASIADKKWIGTTFTGLDEYYGENVNAYGTGTTAVLAVTVGNDEGHDINFTSVIVNFDWGSTYSSDQLNITNPLTLMDHELRVVFIRFQVPSVSVASNLYTHSYTIVANFSYPDPADPAKILTDTYENFDNDFAVYSADQSDAMEVSRIINGFSAPSGGWRSAKAKILWNKSTNETNTGYEYYREGDFYSAKQRFNTALGYVNQAWSAEEAYLTVYEELDINELQASIRNLDAMASFFSGLSVMWILFGLGGVLFAIGYIVKWLGHARVSAKQTKLPQA